MSVAISGFTFIRDAVRCDYPVVESINSILPIVDEFVVNVGRSSDGTLDLVRSIDSPKIRIIESEWNSNVRAGGFVYAQQPDVALFNCRGRWAFYLQSDEVIHEDDLPHLDDMMHQYADDPQTDALALERVNFHGDYQSIAAIPWGDPWSCRIVKPHHFMLSRGDAAGFTVHPKYKERGRCPRTVRTQAREFHYPGLKSTNALHAKCEVEAQVWGEREFEPHESSAKAFYETVPRQFIERYEGTHPAVMTDRIAGYPHVLDLNSPHWRTQLNQKERRRLLMHKARQLCRLNLFDKTDQKKAG